MNLRRHIQNFFGFSRMETNGFLVLMPLVFLILFSEPVYRLWLSTRPTDHSRDVRELDSLVARWELEKAPKKIPTENLGRLFAFNPNVATHNKLLELGFTARLATRIENYRTKGGKFLVKDDLRKIYGMDSLLFAAVRPYIQLPDRIEKVKTERDQVAVSGQAPKKEIIAFDLNTADTTQLKTIYGIGEKLSLRIVKYRESLGGFIHMKQLSEVFGLDSAVVSRLSERSFIANDFKPLQLNLNTATEEALDRHPYISKKEAKAIVAYRFQHRKFSSIEELKKVVLVEEPAIQKMMPYLKID